MEDISFSCESNCLQLDDDERDLLFELVKEARERG